MPVDQSEIGVTSDTALVESFTGLSEINGGFGLTTISTAASDDLLIKSLSEMNRH